MKNTNVRRTKEEVSVWYEEHIAGTPLYELDKKYNTDCKYQFKKFGFKSIKVQMINRKNCQAILYSFDTITNDFEAYILGLIFADGSISNNSLKISLQKADEKLLLKIRDYIIPTQVLHTDKNNRSLIINSKVMIENLKAFGITTNKTYDDVIIPAQIPQDLKPSFIRGYFDGDGTVYYDSGRLRFNICSITEKILIDFQTEFEINQIYSSMNLEIREGKSFINPQGNIISNCRNMYRLIVRRKLDLLKLFSYLYANSTIYLERKYNKFLEYVNTEIS